jgi:hypothetical protein
MNQMTACAAILYFGLLGTFAGAQARDPMEGRFLHHVLFWLTEPDNPQARQQFLAELQKMKAIPTIRSSYVGVPAGTPRDVVDNSWTFTWLVSFEDRAGWQVYNDHAIHQEFVKRAGHLWKRVVVYDSVPAPR